MARFPGGEAAGPIRSIFYGFPLPPMQYAKETPFTVSFAPGLDGGLTAHENGVTSRTIMIQGTFGLQAKPLPDWFGTGNGAALTGGTYVASQLGDLHKMERPEYLFSATGTHLLKLLEDRILDTYAECKRHPQFGALTKLVFHNLKMDEHWVIAPTSWSVQARNTYFTYALTAQTLEPFDGRVRKFENTTKSILSTYERAMKDIAAAKAAIAGVAGKLRSGLKRLQNIVNSGVRLVQSASGILQSVTQAATDLVNFGSTVVQAASRMVTSVEGFLTGPAAVLTAAANFLDGADALSNQVIFLPDRVKGAYMSGIRDVSRAAASLAATAKTLAGSPNVSIGGAGGGGRRLGSRDVGVGDAGLTDAEIDLQEDTDGLLKNLNSRTTEPLSGVRDRAQDKSRTERKKHTYRSIARVAVTSDTTLRSLALQYIGDETAWPDIAALNNLSYPFISERGVRGTKAPGDRIMVPLESSVIVKYGPDAGLIGAGVTRGDEAAALGVDFKLQADVDGLYDLVAAGDDDVRIHRGVNVLQQDIVTSLLILFGRDPLTPGIGLPELLGPGTREHIEMVRYHLRAVALTDPRVISVRELEFRVDLDTIHASYEVEYSTGRTTVEVVRSA